MKKGRGSTILFIIIKKLKNGRPTTVSKFLKLKKMGNVPTIYMTYIVIDHKVLTDARLR